MKRSPCVVSVAEHAGWAHVVSVAMRGRTPGVIDRRRVTLLDPGLPTLPYHHDTFGMEEAAANALIARVRRSIAARTADALTCLVAELAPATAVALAIRAPPLAALPDSVVAAWNSHRLNCVADGVMYHQEICHAARQLGLEVQTCRRGQEAIRAAHEVGATVPEIEDFVSRRGRPAGPPWTQEHRNAYAAGIAVLARYTDERPRIREVDEDVRAASHRRKV